MSASSDLIAELRLTIQELRADKVRLLEMLQLSLDRESIRRQTWRDQKRKTRGVSDGSPTDSPAEVLWTSEDMSGGSPADMGGNLIGGGADVPPSVDVSETLSEKEREASTTTGESAERGSAGHPADKDPQWTTFRKVYPHLTHRTNWTTTQRRFERLSKADRVAAAIGAGHYAPSRDVLSAGEMAAQRFISERTWESWQEPEPALPNGNGKHDSLAAIRDWKPGSSGLFGLKPDETVIEGEVVAR